ncbi:MAG: alkyl sulfatase dimerization domain-containing protein [Pikeienuella sp.]
MTKSDEKRNVLSGAEGVREISPEILILPGQGNALAVRTDSGVVLVDSGPGGRATAAMIRHLRDWTDDPVRAICFSHGHAGYNYGLKDWIAHAEARGDQPFRIIAHENVPRRLARYRETEGLQLHLNKLQFPQFRLAPPRDVLIDPDETFADSLTLEGAPELELIWAPSETDDAIALWAPEAGVLYAGAAFPGSTITNIGTPLRTLRLTVRWAETLERLAALRPRVLVQEFGRMIEGEDKARERLLGAAEALRWMRREVVERMNRGMTDVEIIHDLEYPPALFDKSWMRERYGARDYIVRDLWREENGWWDRNPTSLHPAHPDRAAAAALSAIADPAAVIRRAAQLAEEGETQLALHVIDLIALAPGDRPELREARALKARLCRARAEEIEPYVSKALYEVSAKSLDGEG